LLQLLRLSPPEWRRAAGGVGVGDGVGGFGSGGGEQRRAFAAAAPGHWGEGKPGDSAEHPKGASSAAANEEQEKEGANASSSVAEAKGEADADDDDDDDGDGEEEEEEEEENEHTLHELAAGGGAMRANLEAWLVAACLDGTGTGASTRAPPAAAAAAAAAASSAGCTFLTLAPRPQIAAAVWAQAALARLTAPMRRALQRRGEALVQGAIERDFSADDFCAGCSDAFRSVMRAYGQGRWDLLAGMASPAVIASMRASWADLAARRGLEPVAVAAEARRVSLAAPNVWRRSAVARLDRRRAAAPLPGGCVPWWEAVAVEVEATVDVSLGPAGWREEARARRREAGGGGGDGTAGSGADDDGEDDEEDEDGEGKDEEAPAPVERSSTRRVGYLVFARGPLPRSAAQALYSPWWLIGWY